MNDGTFNFFYDRFGVLYIGDGSEKSGNGAFNKSVVDAILPVYYGSDKVYGTHLSAFEGLSFLKSIFIPKTYKALLYDFCPNCAKLETITFEENSQVEIIGDYFLQGTAITTIILPFSLKKISSTCTFRGCNKLKLIVYMGNIPVGNDNNMFGGVSSDLKIIVSKKYPSKTFGGRNVTSVALPFPKNLLTCTKNRRMKITLFIVIFVYRS